MHHEHHGDCCQPHEPHDHAPHRHAIAQLSQACCAGACHHMDHQAGIEHMLANRLPASETLFTGIDDKAKKKKKKRLGSLSLVSADESTRVMRPNLAQYT